MTITRSYIHFIALLFAALLLLSGCDEDLTAESGRASSDIAQSASLALDRSKLGNRRVAETHIISVETPHERLADRFYRDLEECIAIGCELLDSANNPRGSSYIKLRIEPDKLPDFLAFVLEGPDMIRSHELKVQDKTQESIDAEARLKNLELLRDRLRKMLDTPNSKLSDLLSVQRELTNTETQIDAARAKLRMLETITQKATVHVFYQQPYYRVEVQYYELDRSFELAQAGFIENLADVINFTGRILPWIPVLFFFGWLFVALFKLIFLRKSKKPTKAYVEPPVSKADAAKEKTQG